MSQFFLNFNNGLGPGETARQAQIVALEGRQLGGQRIGRFGLAAALLRCQRAQRAGIALPPPVRQGRRVQALAPQNGRDPAGIGGRIGLRQDAQLVLYGKIPARRPLR